jgi:hypothetical protein
MRLEILEEMAAMEPHHLFLVHRLLMLVAVVAVQ